MITSISFIISLLVFIFPRFIYSYFNSFQRTRTINANSISTLNDISISTVSNINIDVTEDDLRTNAWLQILEVQENVVKLNSVSLPKVNAWQIVDEVVEPPSLLDYFSLKSKLHHKHQEKVNILFSKVCKHVKDDATLALISEALKVAYIGLLGKHQDEHSSWLEEALNRAGGVAAVLIDLQANIEVILCGILHDVITECITENPKPYEKQFYTNNLIGLFGDDVINLSLKYSKLPKLSVERTDYSLLQNEYQLQMLVVTADDYRTLYLRLADRVHTMRVLRLLKLGDEEKKKIALEARHVYASLAHKMNLIRFRSELEDISFRFLQPEEYILCKQTHVRAAYMHQNAEAAIINATSEDEFLLSQNMKCNIVSRVKDKYQLHIKMIRQNISSPSEVKDCLGLRVIIDCPRFKDESDSSYQNRSCAACYHVLSKIRQLPQTWKPEEHYKDYIHGAKDNGYQSLHQNIQEKSGVHIEIQIRTRSMHVNAELGEAAHWYYKDTKYKPELANLKLYKIAWRSSNQLNAKTAAEMIGYAKRQIASARVLVYLGDKSTLLNLERNSSALDGAFAIHSNIGLATKKTFVNGREVSLGYRLQTGDVLTVETNKNQVPCAEIAWFSHVQSTHAVDALRRFLNKNVKNIRASIGCLVLLSVFSLNYDVIVKRLATSVSSKVRGIKIEIGGLGYPDACELMTLIEKQKNKPIKSSTTTSHSSSTTITTSSASSSSSGNNANTIVEYSDISEFLQIVGHPANSRETIAELVSQVLDMKADSLTILGLDSMLIWARTQEKNGWSDVVMRNKVLLPLLEEILPRLGLKTVKEKWMELIGPKSLTDEKSAYYDKLKNRLMIGSKVRHVGSLLSFNPRKEENPPHHRSTNLITHPYRSVEYVSQQAFISSNQENPARCHSVPNIYKKSPYVIAKKPYALEASTLLQQDRLPLLRLAREHESARAMKKMDV